MNRLRPIRWAAVVVVLATALLGCGKRGRPLPPEPNAPLAPSDVALRQVGDTMFVTCTVPGVRGAKPSQTLARVELVRVEFPPGVEVGADAAVFRRRGSLVTAVEGDAVESGARLTLVDRIERSDGTSLVDWTVRYAVRARDRRGRASPLVATPTIVPLEVPGPPGGFEGEAVAGGIALTWDGCDDDGAIFQVYRGVGDGLLGEQPINAAPIEACEFLDGGVRIGTVYRYAVHRLAVADPPPREGPPSRQIVVTASDRFPPGPPNNLVAVQEGPAVRLFWDPGPERDLRGYRVERAVGEGAWSTLTPVPVSDPLFLDPDVRVGQRVRYRVFAEDGAEPPNLSDPSEEVVVVVAADPVTGSIP